jgi:hypothetical protein
MLTFHCSRIKRAKTNQPAQQWQETCEKDSLKRTAPFFSQLYSNLKLIPQNPSKLGYYKHIHSAHDERNSCAGIKSSHGHIYEPGQKVGLLKKVNVKFEQAPTFFGHIKT